MFAWLNSLLRSRRADRCPICGEAITGDGVERYGKRFCRTWHADFYRPQRSWRRRLRWPGDAGDGGGAGCCA